MCEHTGMRHQPLTGFSTNVPPAFSRPFSCMHTGTAPGREAGQGPARAVCGQPGSWCCQRSQPVPGVPLSTHRCLPTGSAARAGARDEGAVGCAGVGCRACVTPASNLSALTKHVGVTTPPTAWSAEKIGAGLSCSLVVGLHCLSSHCSAATMVWPEAQRRTFKTAVLCSWGRHALVVLLCMTGL